MTSSVGVSFACLGTGVGFSSTYDGDCTASYVVSSSASPNAAHEPRLLIGCGGGSVRACIATFGAVPDAVFCHNNRTHQAGDLPVVLGVEAAKGRKIAVFASSEVLGRLQQHRLAEVHEHMARSQRSLADIADWVPLTEPAGLRRDAMPDPSRPAQGHPHGPLAGLANAVPGAPPPLVAEALEGLVAPPSVAPLPSCPELGLAVIPSPQCSETSAGLIVFRRVDFTSDLPQQQQSSNASNGEVGFSSQGHVDPFAMPAKSGKNNDASSTVVFAGWEPVLAFTGDSGCSQAFYSSLTLAGVAACVLDTRPTSTPEHAGFNDATVAVAAVADVAVEKRRRMTAILEQSDRELANRFGPAASSYQIQTQGGSEATARLANAVLRYKYELLSRSTAFYFGQFGAAHAAPAPGPHHRPLASGMSVGVLGDLPRTSQPRSRSSAKYKSRSSRDTTPRITPRRHSPRRSQGTPPSTRTPRRSRPSPKQQDTPVTLTRASSATALARARDASPPARPDGFGSDVAFNILAPNLDSGIVDSASDNDNPDHVRSPQWAGAVPPRRESPPRDPSPNTRNTPRWGSDLPNAAHRRSDVDPIATRDARRNLSPGQLRRLESGGGGDSNRPPSPPREDEAGARASKRYSITSVAASVGTAPPPISGVTPYRDIGAAAPLKIYVFSAEHRTGEGKMLMAQKYRTVHQLEKKAGSMWDIAPVGQLLHPDGAVVSDLSELRSGTCVVITKLGGFPYDPQRAPQPLLQQMLVFHQQASDRTNGSATLPLAAGDTDNYRPPSPPGDDETNRSIAGTAPPPISGVTPYRDIGAAAPLKVYVFSAEHRTGEGKMLMAQKYRTVNHLRQKAGSMWDIAPGDLLHPDGVEVNDPSELQSGACLVITKLGGFPYDPQSAPRPLLQQLTEFHQEDVEQANSRAVSRINGHLPPSSSAVQQLRSLRHGSARRAQTRDDSAEPRAAKEVDERPWRHGMAHRDSARRGRGASADARSRGASSSRRTTPQSRRATPQRTAAQPPSRVQPVRRYEGDDHHTAGSAEVHSRGEQRQHRGDEPSSAPMSGRFVAFTDNGNGPALPAASLMDPATYHQHPFPPPPDLLRSLQRSGGVMVGSAAHRDDSRSPHRHAAPDDSARSAAMARHSDARAPYDSEQSHWQRQQQPHSHQQPSATSDPFAAQGTDQYASAAGRAMAAMRTEFGSPGQWGQQAPAPGVVEGRGPGGPGGGAR